LRNALGKHRIWKVFFRLWYNKLFAQYISWLKKNEKARRQVLVGIAEEYNPFKSHEVKNWDRVITISAARRERLRMEESIK
jgi:hypothetical protein